MEASSTPLEPLSSAERQVVALLLQGASNFAIARRRGTSERTVANQLSSAYRKLGVGSRAGLAQMLLVPRDCASLDLLSRATSLQVLTPRERRVAAYVALGWSNKQVAHALGLAVSTVGSYAASAMRKVGTATRVDLIKLLSHQAPQCASLAQLSVRSVPTK